MKQLKLLGKKLKTHWLGLFIGMALLLLNACAQVEIKDTELCGDFGPEGASCFHLMTPAKRRIDKPVWDVERVGQLCITAQGFADFKQEIEQLCSLSDKCTYENKKLIADFFHRVDTFNKEVEELVVH